MSSGRQREGIIEQPVQQFEELLVAEVPYLRRYARALTGSAAAADDLVQDCLERALRKRRLWRPSGRLRSWLMRMLYRIHLNGRKRRAVESAHARREGGRGEPVAAQRPELSHECRELVDALHALPEPQRAAILLVALEDVDYQEAAWILGIPVGTLRSRLSRGRETLRRITQAEVEADAPVLRSVK